MNYDLVVLLSFSVLIAAGIAFFKFSGIKRNYYPFIFLIWIASVNEIISYFLIKNGHYNIINSNIYCLVESLLLLWFFKNTGNFKKRPWVFNMWMMVFILAWIINGFLFHRFDEEFISWFMLVYAFPVVLLSINTINRLLFKEKDILKNPVFLICIGLIIFFTYGIVIEVFWMYGFHASELFATRVYDILSIINLICNLIYALAILWMKKKHAFTLQF